jgi:hypothetical protein
VEKGVDYMHADIKKQTAMNYAKKNNKPNVVDYL